MNRLAVAAALAVAVVALPAVAHAQDDADTKQAKEHFQKGMQAFQSGDFPTAVAELKQAYQLKRLPALLFNIGQTYRKMDEIDLAIFYFEKYLKEAPQNAPQRGEADKILAELKAKKSRSGGQVTIPPPLEGGEAQPEKPSPGEAAPAPRRRRVVAAFEHTPVEEAPPTVPLDIRIMLPEQEGLRATLYYRGPAQEQYAPIAMHQRYDEWVGRIPADAIAGKSFYYYIEARDASGKIIGKSGSAPEPNIVSIVATAKPQFYADLTEGPSGGEMGAGEAQPVVKKSKRRRRRARSEDEAEDEGDEEPGTLHNFRRAKWISAGVAAGALVLGTTFELLASSAASDVEKKACQSPQCPSPNSFFNGALQDTESAGQRDGTLGTVFLIVGGVAAATAVTLFLYDDSAEIERDSRARRGGRRDLGVAPLVAPVGHGDLAYGVAGALRF